MPLRDRRAGGSWSGSGASTTGPSSSADDQLDLLDTYLHRFGDRIIGTEADRDTKDCFLHLRFLARDLPAVGHAQYRLTDEPATGRGRRPVADPVTRHARTPTAILDNEHLEVTLTPTAPST